MNGHIAIPTGGGAKPSNKTETKIDDDADVRDILTGLVAKGKGLPTEDLSAYAMRLAAILGRPTAQKIVNHILVFNQRGDVQNKSAEQRVEQFYNMGSMDKDIDAVMAKSKSLGYGVQVGLRESPDILNMEASGRKPFKDDKISRQDADKVKAFADKYITLK